MEIRAHNNLDNEESRLGLASALLLHFSFDPQSIALCGARHRYHPRLSVVLRAPAAERLSCELTFDILPLRLESNIRVRYTGSLVEKDTDLWSPLLNARDRAAREYKSIGI